MKKSYFLVFLLVSHGAILSSENWKDNLQKASPTTIQLHKEQRALEIAYYQKNQEQAAYHDRNVEILALKQKHEIEIALYEQKISAMQCQLEDKDKQINELKSHK